MKIFEQLSPEERKVVALDAAAFSSGIEGMNEVAEQLIRKAQEIRESRSRLSSALSRIVQL
ncbi:MAG: hypothetical protein GKR95_18770 [Gammaproteobacteria bacterium]|nr:hypothetical protein [Gammaproteobacteria bacterium]